MQNEASPGIFIAYLYEWMLKYNAETIFHISVALSRMGFLFYFQITLRVRQTICSPHFTDEEIEVHLCYWLSCHEVIGAAGRAS